MEMNLLNQRHKAGVNNVWHVSTMNKSQEEIDASVYWVKWMTSDQSLSDYTKSNSKHFWTRV